MRRSTGCDSSRVAIVSCCGLCEIADLLAVREAGICPCEPADQLLRRRMSEIDAKIARLTALRIELARYGWLRCPATTAPPRCPNLDPIG